MNIQKWLSKNSSGILSFVACVGVAVTAVLSYKGAIKAQETIKEWTEEKHEELTTVEKVQASAKHVVPAAVAGAATIGCIVASHKIDQKQIVMLTGAVAAVSKKYDDYRKANIKVNGKEAHDKVMEEIAVEKAREGRITGESMFTICDLNSSLDGEERLFYDAITETYFTSTLSRVLDAEYHMNRNMHVEGGCPDLTVQMWCDFLGIDNKKHDKRGWTYCDSYQWLDFTNSDPVDIGDGMECIIIDCVWEPIEDYEDFDMFEDWPLKEPTKLPEILTRKQQTL
ncbi:MAG: hypothetical protein J6U54_07985 [Clostridiales bacterium]|nr:hypothetical protein [Clostridiales bacterium]